MKCSTAGCGSTKAVLRPRNAFSSSVELFASRDALLLLDMAAVSWGLADLTECTVVLTSVSGCNLGFRGGSDMSWIRDPSTLLTDGENRNRPTVVPHCPKQYYHQEPGKIAEADFACRQKLID